MWQVPETLAHPIRHLQPHAEVCSSGLGELSPLYSYTFLQWHPGPAPAERLVFIAVLLSDLVYLPIGFDR